MCFGFVKKERWNGLLDKGVFICAISGLAKGYEVGGNYRIVDFFNGKSRVATCEEQLYDEEGEKLKLPFHLFFGGGAYFADLNGQWQEIQWYNAFIFPMNERFL